MKDVPLLANMTPYPLPGFHLTIFLDSFLLFYYLPNRGTVSQNNIEPYLSSLLPLRWSISYHTFDGIYMITTAIKAISSLTWAKLLILKLFQKTLSPLFFLISLRVPLLLTWPNNKPEIHPWFFSFPHSQNQVYWQVTSVSTEYALHLPFLLDTYFYDHVFRNSRILSRQFL